MKSKMMEFVLIDVKICVNGWVIGIRKEKVINGT